MTDIRHDPLHRFQAIHSSDSEELRRLGTQWLGATRIDLRNRATDDEVAAALAEHESLIADEVLATTLVSGEPDWSAKTHEDAGLSLAFWLRKAE